MAMDFTDCHWPLADSSRRRRETPRAVLKGSFCFLFVCGWPTVAPQACGCQSTDNHQSPLVALGGLPTEHHAIINWRSSTGGQGDFEPANFGTATFVTTKGCQIIPRYFKVRSHFCFHCKHAWHAHSPCACAVCSTGTLCQAPSLQEMSAINQWRIGTSNHFSQSVLAVLQSGNFVPSFSVVFKNFRTGQISSAPNFAIPNFARTNHPPTVSAPTLSFDHQLLAPRRVWMKSMWHVERFAIHTDSVHCFVLCTTACER